MPKLAVDTAVGWKGIRAQLAAFSVRRRGHLLLLGNSARTICVEASAIVQSARHHSYCCQQIRHCEAVEGHQGPAGCFQRAQARALVAVGEQRAHHLRRR